jgi:Helix-turn-helix domain of resolvase
MLKEWNKFVPEYNAVLVPRNVGRPLAASEAQIKTVRKLHAQSMSLRGIADETSLGLRTVRTIVDSDVGLDRQTRKRLQRIAPDLLAERQWQAKKQGRKALPRRNGAALKANAELRKEAKGLK